MVCRLHVQPDGRAFRWDGCPDRLQPGSSNVLGPDFVGYPYVLDERRVRYLSPGEIATDSRLGKLRADLRRLSSVAASPLVTLYNDAIEGIVMIRA